MRARARARLPVAQSYAALMATRRKLMKQTADCVFSNMYTIVRARARARPLIPYFSLHLLAGAV